MIRFTIFVFDIIILFHQKLKIIKLQKIAKKVPSKNVPLIFGLILCVILSDERHFTLIWCKYELNWSVLWIFNRVHIQNEKLKMHFDQYSIPLEVCLLIFNNLWCNLWEFVWVCNGSQHNLLRKTNCAQWRKRKRCGSQCIWM